MIAAMQCQQLQNVDPLSVAKTYMSLHCCFFFHRSPPCRLEDPHSGPLAEVAKWQRRQVVLTSVVEQLKVKECKTVLTTLAVTKSRLLKKWKTIDMQ